MKKTSMGAAAAAVLCAASAFVFSAQPLAAQEAQTEEPAAADGAAQSEQSETVTLTVDEAVEYAMEHSRTLKSAQIDLEMKRRAKQYTWNMFIPSVNANAAVSRSNQVTDSAAMLRNLGLPIPESDPTEGDHWMISGGVSVSLNLSLALIDGIKINTANYEAGLITWEQAVKQNELNIRKLFYALLLQQESLRIQEETLANAESRMIQARTNYRNGRVSELEYLQAQVTYENLKPQLLSAQQSLRQQLDMFAFVLGMPVGTQVALDGVIEPDYLELDVENLISEYLMSNIDVRAMQKNIELLELNLGVQKFQLFSPNLSLSWGWQPYAQPIGDAFGDEWYKKDNGAFSARLSWNLFEMLPFSQSFQAMKDTEDQIRQLEINMETLVENTELDIRTQVDALASYRAAIEANDANIALAQRSYDMTVIAYRNGTRELLDVRDAENQLNTAKLGLINEKYNYLAGVLDLEYTLNTKLMNTEPAPDSQNTDTTIEE